jgi:hypothetical protein
MACITKQRVGKYTYLYESISFRNENGQPRNKKTKIGKIHHITGERIYTPEYIKLHPELQLKQDNSDTQQNKGRLLQECPNEADEATLVGKGIALGVEHTKNLGLYYFYRHLAESIGLWDILQNTVPLFWKEIFTLACYLIASDKPVMYCSDWLSGLEWLNVEKMTSQYISDIFSKIEDVHRLDFFRT